MDRRGHSIYAYWGPRRETPQSIAKRFLTLIDRLAPIDPVFGNWICAVDGEPVPLEDVQGDMTNVVESGVSRSDDGDPTPVYGYSVIAVNNTEPTPFSIGVSVHAGRWASGPGYINRGEIESSDRIDLDPTLVTFAIFRAALLALAESFEVTWCSAYPKDLTALWRNKHFRLAWMSYISPRFAPLITPPKTAIVEYRPNGGLFMAATDETFVTANPAHLAVARDIEAAIAPLNALPWPLDPEPE